MDNKQRFAMLNKYKELVKKICPNISNKSGIYLFYRKNESNEFCVYVGQAKNLLERTASHFISRKTHIDKSLYVHKIYSEENPFGWKLKVLKECPFNELDRLEQSYIEYYVKWFCRVYNVTGGGQKNKKQDINKRQQTKLKSYKNGKNIADKKTKSYIREIFNKYLYFDIKPPANKIKQRKFEEFKKYLEKTDED